ncbi:mRNA export factor mex67 [Yarrowia sp. C11]|nr:mRNA export factor mex67 [Yarrowia sp. E02]KAG5369821.1 mRNA export factor mex67 [Yarrowia sp. C11]
MSYRGRGRGRGGYNNSGGRDNGNQGNLTDIEVRGWTNAPKDDLVRFLQDKGGFRLQDVHVSGDVIKARVKNSDSRAIAQWSGRRFAGQALQITVKEGPSAAAQSTIETLKRFLESRYSRENKLLNLAEMGRDQYLIDHGLLATTERGSKMFLALLKIAGDTYPVVDSVDLGSNSIADISGITTLSQTYPGLKNLSLANNQIARIADLESWRHKFTSLRELVLVGNPITNQPDYQQQVAQLFPRLIVLDNNVIRDESQIGKVKYPIPLQQTFFVGDDIQQMVASFLSEYFRLYDSDRQQLLQLYDSESTFSVAICSNSPRTLVKGLGQPPWGQYIPLSRNLLKATTPAARTNRLFVGPEQIGKAFTRLPKTKHDLADMSKFAIEAWTLTGVRQPQDAAIFASVHGEYEENMIGNKSDTRSFDRTFVLIPGPNSMLIASDTLMVRSYAGKDGWTSTAMAGPAAEAGGDEFAGLTPDQAMIVKQLMEATRLNVRYARMCCEQAGFVPEQTMALFKQAQENGSLGPDAFMA